MSPFSVDLSLLFLPADYVAEEKQRMEMYKRIASVVTDEERADVTDELIDRYGELPVQTETLLDVSQLRALCNRVGVSVVSRGKEGLSMKLDERYVPDAKVFLQAIAETDGRLSLTARAPFRLMLKVDAQKDAELVTEGLKVMRKLCRRVNELLEEQKAAEEPKAETAAE